MRKSELSVFTLLLSSCVLGSIISVSLGGCKPPTVTNVDVSTGQYVPSNVTADSSNVTVSADAPSNTTVTSPSLAVEVPVDPSDSGQTVENEPGDATTLVSETVDEIHPPAAVLAAGGDWPQWGGTREKNNAPNVKNLPLEWNIGKFDRRSGEWDSSKAVNINWYALLGSQTYGNPVVADGQIYVGTNNGAGHLKRYPPKIDLGCLLAFNVKAGDFLWQHSSEKLDSGRVHDWPLQGICCSPLVEGERLWFVTSRGEVRCVDTKGFHDDEDDGPVKDEDAPIISFMQTGPTADAHAETLQGLAEGKLADVVAQALAEAGEPVEGDVTLEDRPGGHGVESRRELRRNRPRVDRPQGRRADLVLQIARRPRQARCRRHLGLRHDGPRNGHQPAQHVFVQRDRLRRSASGQHQQRCGRIARQPSRTGGAELHLYGQEHRRSALDR